MFNCQTIFSSLTGVSRQPYGTQNRLGSPPKIANSARCRLFCKIFKGKSSSKKLPQSQNLLITARYVCNCYRTPKFCALTQIKIYLLKLLPTRDCVLNERSQQWRRQRKIERISYFLKKKVYFEWVWRVSVILERPKERCTMIFKRIIWSRIFVVYKPYLHRE